LNQIRGLTWNIHIFYVVENGISVLVHNTGGLIRVKPYTNSKGAQGISNTNIIKASD